MLTPMLAQTAAGGSDLLVPVDRRSDRQRAVRASYGGLDQNGLADLLGWLTFLVPAGLLLSRVLPPQDYPILDLALTHPLFRVQFDVDEFPQIPSIQFWRTSGGGTSERGPDSAVATFKAAATRLLPR